MQNGCMKHRDVEWNASIVGFELGFNFLIYAFPSASIGFYAVVDAVSNDWSIVVERALTEDFREIGHSWTLIVIVGTWKKQYLDHVLSQKRKINTIRGKIVFQHRSKHFFPKPFPVTTKITNFIANITNKLLTGSFSQNLSHVTGYFFGIRCEMKIFFKTSFWYQSGCKETERKFSSKFLFYSKMDARGRKGNFLQNFFFMSKWTQFYGFYYLHIS